jgi:hypothetical protein
LSRLTVQFDLHVAEFRKPLLGTDHPAACGGLRRLLTVSARPDWTATLTPVGDLLV